jgi:adenosylcobyric acid synthase
MGATEAAGLPRPFSIVGRQGVAVDDLDGAVSPDGRVVGTYLHGLFAGDALRRALLAGLAGARGRAPDPRWGTPSSPAGRYDRLADIVADGCDVPAIGALVGLALPGRRRMGAPGPG